MSTCKPVTLKFPNNAQIEGLIKSHTKSGATVLKTGLAYLKKVFKHDPVDDPEIVRKKNNGTADGRFDPTGAKKYRIYTSGNGKPHKGVDLKGDVGDDIYAIACGTVDVARTKDPYKKGKKGGEYGKYVRIHHGSNIYSVYAHLSEVSVKVGSENLKVKRYEENGWNKSVQNGDLKMYLVLQLPPAPRTEIRDLALTDYEAAGKIYPFTGT